MTTQAAARTRLARHRSWAAGGTELFLRTMSTVSDPDLDGPSLLPGWDRRHLLAHVATNAEALGRLMTWARTGVRTPMYASSEQRARDIEEGSKLPPEFLRTWVLTSAQGLGRAMDELAPTAWSREVTTAQGRVVAASVVPWLRCREVYVHSVDLGGAVGFADLPSEVLVELVDEIVAKRSGEGRALTLHVPGRDTPWTVAGRGPAVDVSGDLPRIAAWLTGRDSGAPHERDGRAPHDAGDAPHDAGDGGPRTSDGAALPALGPWL